MTARTAWRFTSGRRVGSLAALLGLLAGSVAGQPPSGLATRLRVLEQAAALSDARQSERDRRAQEAGSLADEIAALKQRGAAPRADRRLEARLRDFDRLATRLDDADRRLQDAERQRAEALRVFQEGVEAETLALAVVSDATQRAQRAAALADAQRRAERYQQPGTASPFRPLLDVPLGAHESGPDLETKVALLRAEQARGQAELERLARALRLLDARLELARRLALEAESARRDAGSGQPLLQREADTLKLQVRGLHASREALAGVGVDLRRALDTIEARLIEAARRRQAGLGSEAP